jgi:Omp85 superfamily domain
LKDAIYIKYPNDRLQRHRASSLPAWQAAFFVAILAMLLGSSCATNLYLNPGELLLKSDPSFSKTSDVSPDSTVRMRIESLKELGLSTVDPDLLYSSVRSRPNRRMVFPKTYLHLYNLGRTLQRYEYAPERWLHFFSPNNHVIDSIASFLVNFVGEPPIVIDTALLAQDVANLKNVYFAQGFFHAHIYYRIDTCKSHLNQDKAKVTFLIDEGKAAIIDKIRAPLIADEDMRKVLLRNMADSYLHSGDTYVEDKLSAERGRIAGVMRNNGYFTFSPKMVFFDIDTLPPDTLGTIPNNEAIKDYQPIWIQIKIPDRQAEFKIGRVAMIIEPAEFDPQVDSVMKIVSPGGMTDSLRRAWHLSPTDYSDSSKITFVTYERVLESINLNFLEKLVTLVEGEQYLLSNERKTQQRLQNLGIFKYVLLKPTTASDSSGVVDFTIQAVLMQRYQVKAGFEGFFKTDPILKSNLPGVGAEIGFRDKLLFNGAEKLDINAKGSVRFYRSENDGPLKSFTEGSASMSLQFPRIVAPGLARKNIQGFEPTTHLTANFKRQTSSDYTRNAVTLDWNYRWYHSSTNKKAQSSLSPYVVNFIQSQLGETFKKRIIDIQNDGLRALISQDYRPRFSSWGNYKFSYSTEADRKYKHHLSFYGNFQMGGNTPYLIDRFSNLDTSYADQKLRNIFYGQYFKVTAEFKNAWPIGRHASFVLRNYAGVAQPWNHTRFVPLESRFFTGGSNSMRGWQSNTLGPGTYNPQISGSDSTDLGFLVSPGGELVFETNFELRADVYKWIKLAIFSDVGNVWFLPNSEVTFKGAKWDKRTRGQLGVDAGLGVRLDFDFFLFRLDVARQVYSPVLKGLVTKSRLPDLGTKPFQLNFGIGYPF